MPQAASAPVLLVLSLLLLGCDEQPPGPVPEDAAAIAALEGGQPLPPGELEILFPWIGKQSLMCVGDAVERQVAFVDFSAEEHDPVGTVTVDARGRATGTFRVAVGELRTGHVKRDAKLKDHNWLEAEAHPHLTLACTGMTRVGTTVWRVEGTWTMHGVTRPVRFLANVRYVGEMRNVGARVVRVACSFPVRLRDFEIVNPSVGTPAVAESWLVDVVLLGVITNGT